MAADKPVEKLRDMILHEVAPSLESPHSKVSIVGAGQVGMACAFALLSQQVCSELALVDKNIDKLRGELMDLKHGLAYLRHCHIKASADCSVTAKSVFFSGRKIIFTKNIYNNTVRKSPSSRRAVVSARANRAWAYCSEMWKFFAALFRSWQSTAPSRF